MARTSVEWFLHNVHAESEEVHVAFAELRLDGRGLEEKSKTVINVRAAGSCQYEIRCNTMCSCSWFNSCGGLIPAVGSRWRLCTGSRWRLQSSGTRQTIRLYYLGYDCRYFGLAFRSFTLHLAKLLRL